MPEQLLRSMREHSGCRPAHSVHMHAVVPPVTGSGTDFSWVPSDELTSKMSMAGWWMVTVIVRPVAHNDFAPPASQQQQPARPNLQATQ